MSTLELVLNMLEEATTTELTKVQNPKRLVEKNEGLQATIKRSLTVQAEVDRSVSRNPDS